jgi:hypothetical protein
MNEQIARLEAAVDALHILTKHAYAKFIFLRPMLANKELHDRINKEGKALGFKMLRLWLYWGLVQELSNICSDKDPRSSSIATVTEKLKNDQLRKQLEEKYVKNPYFGEAELRAEFNHKYSDYMQRAEEMLASRAVGGYKQIRNKLISHNDLQRKSNGYDFFDVKDANVEFGDERKLLETLQALLDDLLLIVRNTDYSWDFLKEEEIARDFWGT